MTKEMIPQKGKLTLTSRRRYISTQHCEFLGTTISSSHSHWSYCAKSVSSFSTTPKKGQALKNWDVTELW